MEKIFLHSFILFFAFIPFSLCDSHFLSFPFLFIIIFLIFFPQALVINLFVKWMELCPFDWDTYLIQMLNQFILLMSSPVLIKKLKNGLENLGNALKKRRIITTLPKPVRIFFFFLFFFPIHKTKKKKRWKLKKKEPVFLFVSENDFFLLFFLLFCS